MCNLDCVYCEGNKGYRKDKMGAMEDFRRTPLSQGNITYEELMSLLKVFKKEEILMIPHGEKIYNILEKTGMYHSQKY